MTVQVAMFAWPLLMVVTALLPVIMGIRAYRRSR